MPLEPSQYDVEYLLMEVAPLASHLETHRYIRRGVDKRPCYVA